MDKMLDTDSAMDIQPDDVPAYQFTSPDPDSRCAPFTAARNKIRFDEEGRIIVKNPSAFWFPDVTIQREIDGTIYSVTGSYNGSETLDEKLTRMMEQDAKNLEESE